MEWRAGTKPNSRSVVVPDAMVPAILEGLRHTGVPIDPYRDQEMSSETTRLVSEAIARMRDQELASVQESVRRELRARELPAWSKEMIQKRIKENSVLSLLEDLCGICEFALRENVKIEILGQ